MCVYFIANLMTPKCMLFFADTRYMSFKFISQSHLKCQQQWSFWLNVLFLVSVWMNVHIIFILQVYSVFCPWFSVHVCNSTGSLQPVQLTSINSIKDFHDSAVGIWECVLLLLQVNACCYFVYKEIKDRIASLATINYSFSRFEFMLDAEMKYTVV